jgi:hypothetical protein
MLFDYSLIIHSLLIHSIHSSFNRGDDWRALNSLVVFDFWMFRVIGVCFPLDKFIELKSVVVFGLDVSIAFPAINLFEIAHCFWFGCFERFQIDACFPR